MKNDIEEDIKDMKRHRKAYNGSEEDNERGCRDEDDEGEEEEGRFGRKGGGGVWEGVFKDVLVVEVNVVDV